MNYILKIQTRYRDSENVIATNWTFKTYDEACKRMIERLEALNRQIMSTDLTNLIGFTIVLTEWNGGNNFTRVAWIDYDLAL